jgi:hypothetical protein
LAATSDEGHSLYKPAKSVLKSGDLHFKYGVAASAAALEEEVMEEEEVEDVIARNVRMCVLIQESSTLHLSHLLLYVRQEI